MSILRGHGLDVRANAIRAAMQSKPDHDHVAAAETVVEWVKAGDVRNRQAGVLLDAALRAQRQDFYGQAQRWARRVLPDECEPFVISTMAVLRYAGQPVTRNTVLARLRATGRDAATLGKAAGR